MFNKVIFSISILLCVLVPLVGKEDHRIESQPVAIANAIEISNEGVLKQKENGFVYLDVSNAFIDSVVSQLDLPGELRPRPTASRSMGAHISVFHESENVVPEELGKNFSFEVQDVRSFTLHTRDGLKKLWVISVASPELGALRVKYDCPPKWKGYSFHITLGKQMPTAPEGWEKIEELSPLNFSDEPVRGLETEGDFITVESEEILAVVEKVNAIGQLKLKSNGYVYLDVANQLAERVALLLPVEGNLNPVATTAKKIGAHISVMYEDEVVGKEIWSLAEAGQWFQFEVKQVRYVDRKTSKGDGYRLWLIAVDAPGLQRLRQHYGLKPKLQNRDFHITVGYEHPAEEVNSVEEAA